MPPVEKHRGLPVGRSQLQAPGSGLVGGFDLGDDAGQRSVAQSIFG
jgi:hypothetical protein